MTDTHPTHETRRIEIPESTASALAQRLDGTEFESVDDYATFALEQLLDQLDRFDAGEGVDSSAAESIEDGQTDGTVENRLESLGYL